MRIAAAVAAILPCCFLWKRYQGSLSPAWAMDDGAGQTSPARPRAHTACGDVEGVWEKDLAAFRGIPYGRAPIGSRRWKPADPAPCWPAGSVFNASRNGNICYQGSGGGPGESEDCLNLNVFAPNGAAAAAPLPVFVWIYGGSNVQGSVHADFYGPIENIVRRQRCILVAMNYRLGTLGFLALKELSAVDPRGNSGNAGIADQQLAMRWVQENIHAFGGDPRRVTLIGQSSGGTNILGHLASGSSRKLFHGAIALSPSVKTNRAGGLKLHSSPAHLLQQLAPPHCSLSLNFNDRRWVAKWQIESDFFIPPYHLKHHTKTFNLTTWQQRLLDMHRFCWDKWELCKTTHPLPTGVQAQVPGKVDPEILKELAKVVQSLPEPKKY